MEQTTKRTELTELLARLLAKTPTKLLDKVIYLMQGRLYPNYVGVEIGVGEKLALRTIALASGRSLKGLASDYQRLGDVGLVAAAALEGKVQTSLAPAPLTVERVYETLERIATTSGGGSLDAKLKGLSSLLNDATAVEAKHIMRAVTGELRLGIADYTVLDALALAFSGDPANRRVLERAYNLSSDLGAVARTLAERGLVGVHEFRIEVGKPVRPMLAERVATAAEALAKLGGRCAVEYKLDGERLQLHRFPDGVQIFSRRLENITGHYPDAVQLAREHVRANSAIAEAEAVAINEDTGEHLPFQELMHRRRKHGVAEAMERYPIALNFFDVLYADGADLTSQPYRARRRALLRLIRPSERVRVVPGLITNDVERIDRFMAEAVAEGCEGVMAKDLQSVYRAGAREFAWIKLKREYRSALTDTLDLVVIGAFHGRGRRAGTYGTYLLAAYDSRADLFRTVCKIGTGFTDEDLKRFPELLKAHQVARPHARADSRLDADVWFVPHLVIEVIASEITLSPIHTCGLDVIRKGSGLALRFPKYTGRTRDEKGPEDATTVEEIVAIYRGQLKRIEEPTAQAA
jgi:DNA ligase-1